ncbi:MAG: late competence development ComFB family protein [Leptolyngbyaceae cyanobacterium]
MVHAISVPAQTHTDQAYTNVMESLVADEVSRQLKALPPRVLRFIKRAEVATYALNRLPALYASSTQGLTYQQKRAQREFKVKISEAVRQALAAVQVDPLRLSNPLDAANDGAPAVLDALRTLFNRSDLDWSTALTELNRLQVTSQENTIANHPKPEATSWRPGTYGKEVSWKNRTRAKDEKSMFDWNDRRYRL